MLGTSGFMDDVTYGRNGRDAETWRMHRAATTMSAVVIMGWSLMSVNASLSFGFSFIFSFLSFNFVPRLARLFVLVLSPYFYLFSFDLVLVLILLSVAILVVLMNECQRVPYVSILFSHSGDLVIQLPIKDDKLPTFNKLVICSL